MTTRAWLLPLIVLGLVGMVTLTAPAAEEHEEEVTLDQVPAAVKATILKEAAGAKIREIERETKDGKTVYEAEFLVDGKEVEVKIAPDGTLLGRHPEEQGDDDDDDEEDGEDDLTIDQVPEPARGALLRLAGGEKIIEAEREREHGVIVYEAAWMANGTEHGAAVTADGTLIEIEETIPVDQAPAAVRAAIGQQFPAGAKVVVEKKMVVVYEAEARIDGKEKEVLIFPTGRVLHGDDEDDEGDDDDDEDDDD